MDPNQASSQPESRRPPSHSQNGNRLPSITPILPPSRSISSEVRRSSAASNDTSASRPSLRSTHVSHSSPTLSRARSERESPLTARPRPSPASVALSINKLLNQPSESPQPAKESAPLPAEGASKQGTTGADITELCKSELENLRSLLTCKICYSMLYEPYITSCGHTYCYSCLSKSFTQPGPNNCPECRTKLRQAPAPAFLLREIVHSITKKDELLPSDESRDFHEQMQKEQAEKVANDKKAAGGLFRGCFTPIGFLPRPYGWSDSGELDECDMCGSPLDDDGVCPNCGSFEAEDNPFPIAMMYPESEGGTSATTSDSHTNNDDWEDQPDEEDEDDFEGEDVEADVEAWGGHPWLAPSGQIYDLGEPTRISYRSPTFANINNLNNMDTEMAPVEEEDEEEEEEEEEEDSEMEDMNWTMSGSQSSSPWSRNATRGDQDASESGASVYSAPRSDQQSGSSGDLARRRRRADSNTPTPPVNQSNQRRRLRGPSLASPSQPTSWNQDGISVEEVDDDDEEDDDDDDDDDEVIAELEPAPSSNSRTRGRGSLTPTADQSRRYRLNYSSGITDDSISPDARLYNMDHIMANELQYNRRSQQARLPSRTENRSTARRGTTYPRVTNPFMRHRASNRSLREQSSTATLRPSASVQRLRAQPAHRQRAVVEVASPSQTRRSLSHTPSVMNLPRSPPASRAVPAPQRGRPSSTTSRDAHQRIEQAMAERAAALSRNRESSTNLPRDRDWPAQASNPFRPPSSTNSASEAGWRSSNMPPQHLTQQYRMYPQSNISSRVSMNNGSTSGGSSAGYAANSPVNRRSGAAYPAPMFSESGFSYPR